MKRAQVKMAPGYTSQLVMKVPWHYQSGEAWGTIWERLRVPLLRKVSDVGRVVYDRVSFFV